MAGTEWKLVEEGKNPDLPQDQEPGFSTWDDVMGKRQRAESGAQASTSSPGPAASKDRTYYRRASRCMHVKSNSPDAVCAVLVNMMASVWSA